MAGEKTEKEKLLAEIESLKERIAALEITQAGHETIEQKLLESEKLYQLLAENVSDVIWTMDMNLHYTYISPSVSKIRGCSAQEAMSQNIENIFSQDSCKSIRQVFEEELAAIVSGGVGEIRTRSLEARVKCEDGSLKWVEIKATFFTDEKGKPAGVLGITRDIDRRKNVERERMRLLRRQRALLENVPAYIFLKDSRMRYTAFNKAYLDLLPEDISDPIGKRDRDFYHKSVAKRFEKEDRQVLEKGVNLTKEEKMRLRNGRVIDVAVSISPVRDKTGRITGLVGIAFDMTDRKHAEIQLEQYTIELETANSHLAQLMEEVRSLSLTDELTALHNRRGFLTLAEQQLKIANRIKKVISLFFFDLDGMKWINDTLGHKEGDRALKDTADVLRDTFRDSDIIARIGGDEFVVMAVEGTEIKAQAFADRLVEEIEKHNSSAGRPYTLSLSMGVAHYDPEKPCLIDELLGIADKLMYENKRAKQKS